MYNCVKSVQIRSFSGPNTGKYGPEKSPYLDTFHAVYKMGLLLLFLQTTETCGMDNKTKTILYPL